MIEKYALFRAMKALVSSTKKSSVRDISRAARLSASSAKQCLDYLRENKIVNLESVGRSYQYSLNLDNFLARHVKLAMSLSEINGSGIVDELVKKYPHIFSIVLYGSVARGEDGQKSDIDLLMIATKKIKMAPLTSEKKIGREITYLAYTPAEWKKKSSEDKPFYDRVIVDGIPLYGEMPVVG